MADYQEPRDTSPLELEQLSDDELTTILYIERRLYEAQHSDVEEERQRTPKPYLAQVQVRHPRVLLLDGDRGTGKTSILLTLAHRWGREEVKGIARHDKDEDAYKKRVKRLRNNPEFDHGDHDFKIPTHISVVGRILDFDPLPPEMPLLAGIIQLWQGLAEHCDGYHDECHYEGDLMDLWHQLFRTAAVGWTAIPRARGLIEQVLDRQEQIGDWQRLGEQWQEFVDEVIRRGKRLPLQDRLDNPVFVIMIDDVDLQVVRIRELLPALRCLYHPRVVFIVAADRRHMIDILKLDFLGQQNRLAKLELRQDALKGSSAEFVGEKPFSNNRAGHDGILCRVGRGQI